MHMTDILMSADLQARTVERLAFLGLAWCLVGVNKGLLA